MAVIVILRALVVKRIIIVDWLEVLRQVVEDNIDKLGSRRRGRGREVNRHVTDDDLQWNDQATYIVIPVT